MRFQSYEASKALKLAPRVQPWVSDRLVHGSTWAAVGTPQVRVSTGGRQISPLEYPVSPRPRVSTGTSLSATGLGHRRLENGVPTRVQLFWQPIPRNDARRERHWATPAPGDSSPSSLLSSPSPPLAPLNKLVAQRGSRRNGSRRGPVGYKGLGETSLGQRSGSLRRTRV